MYVHWHKSQSCMSVHSVTHYSHAHVYTWHASQSSACIHGDTQQLCTCIHSATHHIHNPLYGHRLTHITIQHVEKWSYAHQTPIYITTHAQMKHIQDLYGGNNSPDWQPPSSPHLASTPECGGLRQLPASPQVLSVDTNINGYQRWTSTLTSKNTNTKSKCKHQGTLTLKVSINIERNWHWKSAQTSRDTNTEHQHKHQEMLTLNINTNFIRYWHWTSTYGYYQHTQPPGHWKSTHTTPEH